MKNTSKGRIISTSVLLFMSAVIAVVLYRQERTVLAVMWTTVVILHLIRLVIIIWKNGKGDREE